MVSASYVDTSVAVHVLLGTATARGWFDDATRAPEPVISSRLLRTELTRVLRREGLPLARRDEVLDHLSVVPLDHAVLQEAEAIVPHVRTLDAIHLASALRVGIDDLVVVTHDTTMRSVAQELGLRTMDPVR